MAFCSNALNGRGWETLAGVAETFSESPSNNRATSITGVRVPLMNRIAGPCLGSAIAPTTYTPGTLV